MPQAIEAHLKNTAEIVDSQKLGVKAFGKKYVGKEDAKNNQNALNAALQLLEEAGKARREVPRSRGKTPAT